MPKTRIAGSEGQLGRLFQKLVRALENWYADPAKAVDYHGRPPVRAGQHGESRPAYVAGYPPINWRTEWNRAHTPTRRKEICWAMLYELDSRAPRVWQYKDFYDKVRYRAEHGSTIGRPLTASRPDSRSRPSRERDGRGEAAPAHD